MAKGLIKREDVYTLRKGELVYDNVRDEMILTDSEVIKLKENKAGSGCIYYNRREHACLIYDHRPAECVALACWDIAQFMEVDKGPKATRKDIVTDRILLGLIEEHEIRCGYNRLETLVKEIASKGEEAVQKIIESLKFDHLLRPFITKKMGIDPKAMDFLFGRPLIETIIMFGLRVTKEPDGSFLLTTSDPHQ
jgi:Fe-S-cluster containining protein